MFGVRPITWAKGAARPRASGANYLAFVLVLVGSACFAPFGVPVRGDDVTMRDLPTAETPTPQELARLLATLDSPAFDFLRDTEFQNALTPPNRPGEQPRVELPENAPPWLRDLVQSLQKNAQANRTDPERPRNPDPASPDPTSPGFNPRPGSGPSRPGTIPPLQPGSPSSSNPAVPSQPPGTPGSSPPFSPGGSLQRPGSRVTSPSGRPTRSGEPRPSSGATNRSEARRAEAERERQRKAERLKSRKQFGERFNRILLEAATNARRDEQDEEGSDFLAGSSDRMLDGVLERIQKMARENRDLTRKLSFKPRRSERNRSSWVPSNLANLNERFKLPAAPNGSDLSRAAAQTGRIGVAAGILIGLLLIGGAIYRWRIGVAERAAHQLPLYSPRPIVTERDLIEAFDDYLLSEFGSAGAWWHCGLIARELMPRQPGLRSEILHLIRSYQRARYGVGRYRKLSDEQLRSCESCLNRMADAQLQSRDPQRAAYEAPA